MLASTPEWVGDWTAVLALLTAIGAVIGMGTALWRGARGGLDHRIIGHIDHATDGLKAWIKGELDVDRAENQKRWSANADQHAAVVARIEKLDNRMTDTEAFLEHQIDRKGFGR